MVENKVQMRRDGSFTMLVKVDGVEQFRKCFLEGYGPSLRRKPEVKSGELLVEYLGGAYEIITIG